MYIIWLFMAGVHVQELILGAFVSMILSYLLSSYVNFSFDAKSILRIILFITLYIPALIFDLIKANIDVAKRVLNPKLPINPGFVKVPTEIEGELGKLVLANSITLTPGTISIDADKENVFIHWIDVKGENGGDYQKHVSSSFEKILRRIFND